MALRRLSGRRRLAACRRGHWCLVRGARHARSPGARADPGARGGEARVAILPFANMSSKPGQEWFADGMTDDLNTGLSKIDGLLVIARNSTFVYKGQNI